VPAGRYVDPAPADAGRLGAAGDARFLGCLRDELELVAKLSEFF
jgi:hypothetical protein